MRIGIFTETYTPYISGLVTSEVMLKKGLEKLGHKVYIVSANLESFKYEYDKKNRVLLIPGVPTGIYDSRLTSIYPLKAVKIIKKWNLDVIHTQTEFAIGTFARVFATQYNIALVHTYHTMYEEYIYYVTHGYFDKASKKLVEYLTKFYCETTATELIVPTEKMQKLFVEKYEFKKNINIIPTGIETSRFYKENLDNKLVKELKKSLNITNKDFIILFLGRLGKEKNVEFLIDAQKELVKKNKNIKLLIIGDGPDKKEYLKMIEENNLSKNVILTGKVKWEETPYYYRVANIFASASNTETQGLTIIEAMASTLLPVCIKDEAFESMIEDNVNGIIFKTKEEYINKVLELIDNKDKLIELSNNARKESEKYSEVEYAKKVEQIYLKAIKEKRKENRFGIISKITKKFRRDEF